MESIEICDEDEQGFANADYIVLVGAKPRGPGMDRKDLLQSNSRLFQKQAGIINKVCKKTTKILVVGNPCNTNSLAMKDNLSEMKVSNLTALSRLDQKRAMNFIGKELDIESSRIFNVNIIGNHSKTLFVDISSAFYVKISENVNLLTIRFEDIKEGIVI